MTTPRVVNKLKKFQIKKRNKNPREPNICFHISRMSNNYTTTLSPELNVHLEHLKHLKWYPHEILKGNHTRKLIRKSDMEIHAI